MNAAITDRHATNANLTVSRAQVGRVTEAVQTWMIRRRCRQILSALEIPVPFDLERFCDTVAAARQRPIRLCPVSMPADGPSGVWIAYHDADYIVYEANTTPLHQEHIIMHEMGHVLSDHQPGPAIESEHAPLPLEHLDARLISRVLKRADYLPKWEVMAETLASMVLAAGNRWKPESEWERSPDDAPVRLRVHRTIEPAPDHRPY